MVHVLHKLPHLLPSLQGAKVFHLSGLIHSQHPEVDLHSLGRMFSVRKCTPLESRTIHPYMLLDGEWCHMLLTGLVDGSLVCTIVHIILGWY